MRRFWKRIEAATVVLGFALVGITARAQPTAITLGTPVSGTIGAAGEVDWYAVSFSVVGDLALTVTAWPPYIETRYEFFGPGAGWGDAATGDDATAVADAGADAATPRDAVGGNEGDDQATCGGCAASSTAVPGTPLVLVLTLALAKQRRRRRA